MDQSRAYQGTDPTNHPIYQFEEAIQLLRQAPLPVFVFYLIGVSPFTILFFGIASEISYNRYAEANLPFWTFGLALTYLWMKGCQALSCREMRKAANPGETFSRLNLWRLFATQAAMQSVSLAARPLGLLLLVTAGPVNAFFQNASILAEGNPGELPRLVRVSFASIKDTFYLTLTIGLVRFTLLLSLWIGFAAIVYLGKVLLGFDHFLTRDFFWVLSLTFLTGILLATYYLSDLLLKAYHVVRVTKLQNLADGVDLTRAWRRLHSVGTVMLTVFLFFSLPAAHALPAMAPAVILEKPAAPANQVDERTIRESIVRELDKPEYGWTKGQKTGSNEWSKSVEAWLRALGDKIAAFLRWLIERIFLRAPVESRPADLRPFGRTLYYLIIFLAVAASMVIFLTLLRHRRKPASPAAKQPPKTPDLEDEDLLAQELPEDEWIALAHQKIAEGDLRLALRALFLAMLALLARRGLIVITRFKSNADYQREITKRNRLAIEAAGVFAHHRSQFEQAWYGDHPTTLTIVNEISETLRRLQSSFPM